MSRSVLLVIKWGCAALTLCAIASAVLISRARFGAGHGEHDVPLAIHSFLFLELWDRLKLELLLGSSLAHNEWWMFVIAPWLVNLTAFVVAVSILAQVARRLRRPLGFDCERTKSAR